MLHPIDDCEHPLLYLPGTGIASQETAISVSCQQNIAGIVHPLLYLPGTGIASQETAISGSFQQNLAGICNSVWVWWLIMGWISR